ncbi:hypothetical protein [Gimesia maris]|uniref:hypothetical protein n=1 Tax=Gimesia maris TaxID=122 RepID=UPI0024202650|nr:hypothetical protein [Gimesia maris]
MTNLKKTLVLTFLAGIFAVSGSSTVSAGYGYPPQRHCKYKQITSYQYQTRYQTVFVTRYDHCGKPFRVKTVRSFIVKVPVTRLVKVGY